jgi:hypothetical protein
MLLQVCACVQLSHIGHSPQLGSPAVLRFEFFNKAAQNESCVSLCVGSRVGSRVSFGASFGASFGVISGAGGNYECRFYRPR